MEREQGDQQFESDVSLLLALSSNKSTDETSRRPPQKRASKACLACRARKVRCDVTVRGTPCMNCRLDNGECIVSGRPTKYRKLNRQGPSSSSAPEPHVLPPQNYEAADVGMPNAVPKAQIVDSRPAADLSMAGHPPDMDERNSRTYAGIPAQQHQYMEEGYLGQRKDGPTERSSVPNDFPGARGNYDQRQWTQPEPEIPIDPALTQPQNDPSGGFSSSSVFKNTLPDSLIGINETRAPDGCVPYTQYHFIKSDNFSHVGVEDIEFLKAQGAFQLPPLPALDEFVQEYFRHVHPHLPLIDEAAFWDSYHGNGHGRGHSLQISLFTFQAMLFACSNSVSVDTLHAVGFRSIRHARATLYRRAKLLFDLDGKRDRISTAQGALLLSYSPDNHNRKINTYWVGVGIRFAKDANAHRYNASPELTPKQQNIKKRLWWCCILRDRILPLGVRRPLHITNEHFDFTSNRPLTAEDLAGEIDHSKVYDAATKRSLAELLAVLCELAVMLTDIIMIVYPVSETPVTALNELTLTRLRVRIERCKADLAQWYDSASVRFPTPAGLGDSNDSLILFTNLMYIYYHTARIALCHHEVLLSEMGSNPDSGYPVQLHRSKRELQESVASMTDIMKELLQLKLAKYMPLSMVAYTALPLVLHVLDVKLSSTRSQCAIKQRRLQIFMEAMQVLQSQYDGTDRVSDYIEKLIRYLASDNPPKFGGTPGYPERRDIGENNSVVDSPSSAISEKSGPTINDWSDVFLRRTNCYLRIVMTVDISFSKGEFPEESDFPTILHSSKLTATLPLYRMDLGNVKNKEAFRPGNQRTNGELHKKFESHGPETNGTVASYSPNNYQQAPPSNATNMNTSLQYDPQSRGGLDPSFQSQIEFSDMGEQAFRDFNLDSWIYDVLPTFT